MQSKKELRLTGRKKRSELSEKQRKEYSDTIRTIICESDLYRKAERILVYVSYMDEVSTWELLLRAIADGKAVYCPKTISGEEKRLDFYRVFSSEDLQNGFRGIKEPAEEPSKALDTVCASDLILIPGCAFDSKGRRLGYGGGFYDRFLAENQNAVKVALCFSCQILDELPEEVTDIRPDYLITEKGIIKCDCKLIRKG